LGHDLQRARREWFKAIADLLRARVETAKAAKLSLAFKLGVNQGEAFNKFLAPSFDSDIAKAEDDLRRHLEKEDYPR